MSWFIGNCAADLSANLFGRFSRYLYIYVPVFSRNLMKVEFGAVQIEFKLIGIFKEGDKY
jgi:hypothetical protein